MTEQANPNELQALRDRVAELEAARDQPQNVNIEGFEGLRQLSHAIETKNLDGFLLDRSVPDVFFWGFLAIFMLILLVGFPLMIWFQH